MILAPVVRTTIASWSRTVYPSSTVSLVALRARSADPTPYTALLPPRTPRVRGVREFVVLFFVPRLRRPRRMPALSIDRTQADAANEACLVSSIASDEFEVQPFARFERTFLRLRMQEIPSPRRRDVAKVSGIRAQFRQSQPRRSRHVAGGYAWREHRDDLLQSLVEELGGSTDQGDLRWRFEQPQLPRHLVHRYEARVGQ